MLWTNKGSELEEFGKRWAHVDRISVFCFGTFCKTFIDEMHDELDIQFIFDNDPSTSGDTYRESEVRIPTEELFKRSAQKIIISSHFEDISTQLQGYGLEEDIHYCDIGKFVSMWNWYRHKKVHLLETHIALTTKCTLNCTHCNMYVPHQKNNGAHLPLNSIKESVDSYFSLVDRAYRFSLLGGEPFLHPDLAEILHYISSEYGTQIGTINLVTNGTIVPQSDVLEIVKSSNTLVSISDYTDSINYENKLQKLVDALTQSSIPYELLKYESWKDFGFPHDSFHIPDDAVEKHMHACAPIFKGLNDNKFYYCHIVWSAVFCGLYEEDPNDSLDLKTLNADNDKDKVTLLEYNLGYMPKGYVSLCKYCRGCSERNNKTVMPGVQQ